MDQDKPKTNIEIHEMSCIPYPNAIGSIMYIVVYTRPWLVQSVLASSWLGEPKMNCEVLEGTLRRWDTI